MASDKTRSSNQTNKVLELQIEGFKSIFNSGKKEIRPLTILSGANSSGKSSFIQPLLLMKQSLEAVYDPGTFLLNGPNVQFTSADQILNKDAILKGKSEFSVALSIPEISGLTNVKHTYGMQLRGGFIENEMTLRKGRRIARISNKLVETELVEELKGFNPTGGFPFETDRIKTKLEVVRRRCFLDVQLLARFADETEYSITGNLFPQLLRYEQAIKGIIHVPGLRGQPARTYKVSEIEQDFPGTFENYVASLIRRWQDRRGDSIENLRKALRNLGLTSQVETRKIDDTQVEIQVGRLLAGKRAPKDLVNIADVGLGVSQVLPVLVALQVAQPGQLIYLEQPELHLHPRAQWKLAEIIGEAINEGKVIVMETHSRALLLGIQALVGEGDIEAGKVMLHWFKRTRNGRTAISSAELDRDGAFGDWPEDFAEIELEAQTRFLDASLEKK